MKTKIEIHEDGEEIKESDICPILSFGDPGYPPKLNCVKCIRGKCALWNDDKQRCGL